MGIVEDILEIRDKKNVSPGERWMIARRLEKENIDNIIRQQEGFGHYEVAEAIKEVADKYLHNKGDDYGTRKTISKTAILGDNKDSFALVIGKKSFKLLGYAIILATIATFGYAVYKVYDAWKGVQEARSALLDNIAEEEMKNKKAKDRKDF